MNILYGVQATGNGHISRSREIIGCLKDKGHDVFVILSGRDPSALWDMEAFKPFTTFKGLTFTTQKGKVKYVKTALNLGLVQFYKDIKSFDASKFDIVITDFEPVSARIAQKFNTPSIGIGHQYAFLHDIPKAGANPVANFIIKQFAPVDYPIGLHWHHFNKPILPPVVPGFEKNDITCIDNKILVYLPFEELEDIMRLIDPFKNYQFFVYHKLDKTHQKENIRLCPFSRTGFLKDLKECCGVITNAGFELVSEALTLGKKLLLKPLAGQMEQLSNALVIDNLKLGTVMHKRDRSFVEKFLNEPPGTPVNYPYTAELIAETIDSGSWVDLDSLVKKAWKNVNLP